MITPTSWAILAQTLILIGVVALCIRYAGDPILDFVREILREISAIVVDPKSDGALDAIGGLVVLIAVVALVTLAPLEVLGGTIRQSTDEASISTARIGLVLGALVIVAIYFLISIRLTRAPRP